MWGGPLDLLVSDDAPQRRAAVRAPRHVLVRYRCKGETHWRTAQLKDVSRVGVRLICEQTFQPGAVVELSMGLPVFPEPVELTARVAWQKSVGAGGLRWSEHGLSFVSVPPELQQRIEDAVQRFLRKH